MRIITEEIRFRQRLCTYAIKPKYGITRAARRYHTNRHVYRQLKKYDGTVRSLALKSKRPHSSPKAHKKEALALIQRMLRRNGVYRLAEVYVRCREKGYKKPIIRRKSYSKYERMDGKYPGDKVQIDIKYVPDECIRFPSYGNRYYQITGIDEYSRKRVLKIVKEKSTYETGKYLMELEGKWDFPFFPQVDNGYEFVNDNDRTAKDSALEKIAKALNMKLRRTGLYSPWQNGNVERSHKEDGKILYGKKVFTSEQKLIRQVAKHETGYNKTAKTGLNFKNPNHVVSEYFSKCNICIDN